MGADVGVAGAHQGPPGRGRSAPRPGVRGPRRALRVARRARPVRRARGPRDEGAHRTDAREQRATRRESSSAATAASATSSSRCSSSNSCTGATTSRFAPGPRSTRSSSSPAGGYVTIADARQLDEAYVWLRTVEHRLQLVDEHQTHTLPVERRSANAPRTRCSASAIGPARRRSSNSTREHQRHQAIVRAIHEKLFFAPLLDTLAGVGALSMDAAQERLTAFGFRDIEQNARRARRAHRRAHPPVPRHAAAAARDARLAVGGARSRPRPARAPAPDRGLQPELDARPPIP